VADREHVGGFLHALIDLGLGRLAELEAEGQVLPEGEVPPLSAIRVATPDYFKTLGIPTLQGRTFAETDDEKTLQVAVINQSLARHRWKLEDPIGRRISFDKGEHWATIAGVVGDVKEFGLDKEAGDELYRIADRAAYSFRLVEEWLFRPPTADLLAMFGRQLPARGFSAPRQDDMAGWLHLNEDLPGWLDPIFDDPGGNLKGLTPEQVDKLATITPYATGATIKDLVNEALIITIRDGREIITWKDVIRAKQLKDLGPPEDVEYIERERHAVAVHEACHAVVAFRTRQHMEIDIATIEKGSDYLGMVASIPPEDQFTRWRSEYESDILVSLASLAGERMFFDGDSSSGVSGDLESATAVASFMEGYWGMGHTVSSYSTARRLEVGSPGGGRGGPTKGESTEKVLRAALADRIEDQLAELLTKAEEILRENRLGVLALAHALETHKTLSGEDVEAVLDQRTGVTVDGTVYNDPEFIAQLEAYHDAAAGAHVGHTRIDATMPEGGRLEPPPVPEVPEPVGAGYGYGQSQGYGAPAPGNGQGHQGPWHGAPGYGYPPPGGNGSTGNGGGAGYGGASGYPPPPPVPGWGRPTPDPDVPTQGYGPTQPGRPEPGSDTPTQGYGPTQPGTGNGTAPSDNGQTSPAEWYPTEPLYRQPETGPVQVVGEPPVDTPPTGEPRVGESRDDRSADAAVDSGPANGGPREARTSHPNGQADHGPAAESEPSDDDRAGPSKEPGQA
jgi:hypothetical protein